MRNAVCVERKHTVGNPKSYGVQFSLRAENDEIQNEAYGRAPSYIIDAKTKAKVLTGGRTIIRRSKNA